MDNLEELAGVARGAIEAAEDVAALEHVRVEYLGKKGQLTGLLKGLSALSAEERPAAGAKINVVKQELQAFIGERRSALIHRAAQIRNQGLQGFARPVLGEGRGEEEQEREGEARAHVVTLRGSDLVVERQAEGLGRDRLSVLQAGVTDVSR